jgi:hypothetical protein
MEENVGKRPTRLGHIGPRRYDVIAKKTPLRPTNGAIQNIGGYRPRTTTFSQRSTL